MSARLIIEGGMVLPAAGSFIPARVYICDGVIVELEEAASSARIAGFEDPSTEVVDACGLFVIPGLVDTHVHGGLGSNFMQADAEAVGTIASWLVSHGVTACLAATASVPAGDLQRSLEGIGGLVGRTPDGPDLLGVHLEGPYLNPERRGVHIAQNLRTASTQELAAIRAVLGSSLKIVTLAPELPGGLDAVDYLVGHKVVASMGHTAADYDQACEAIEHGVSRGTHVFNAMPSLHHRDAGPVLALFESPEVFIEIVADGEHVSTEMIAFTHSVIGPDRLVLVSDGVDVAGLPDGDYTRWEGTPVRLSQGRSVTRDGGIAGSTGTLAGALQLLASRTSIPLEDIVRAAATNPARSIGAVGKGVLGSGYDADVVLMNQQLDIVRTLSHGETIYLKEKKL